MGFAMRYRFRCLIFVAALHASLVSMAWGDGVLTTLALTGRQAPGVEMGTVFSQLVNPPALNAVGQVAFQGRLEGPGVTFANNSGVWRGGVSGGLSLAVRDGMQAPGAPAGVLFDGFLSPAINNSGQLAYVAFLDGPNINTTNDEGVWSDGGPAGLTMLARQGNSAVGASAPHNHFGSVVMNDAGETAFFSDLNNSASDRGIWSESSGSLAPVAIEGNQAPGLGTGIHFSQINFLFLDDLALNEQGQMAFQTELDGPGIEFFNNEAVYVSAPDNGPLELVARKGETIASLTPGHRFDTFIGEPGINAAGEVAFSSFYEGPDFFLGNAIWRGTGAADLAPAILSGQAADLPAGFEYIDFDAPVINAAGEIAFRGYIFGPDVNDGNDEGVWSERAGAGFSLLAREGEQAPGVEDGSSFEFFNSFQVVLNGSGETAFRAGLKGPEIDSSNDRGIWAQHRDGILRLIAREGDQIDVNDNPLVTDLRTILTLDFHTGSGNEDGRRSGFNNRGEVAFSATFTDGSEGIFISQLVARAPMDYNDDGTVDRADYALWAATYGNRIAAGMGADGNGNGIVDAADYTLWQDAFSFPPLSLAVPEPVAMAVVCLLLVALSCGCRVR